MSQFQIKDNGSEMIQYTYPTYAGYVSRGLLSYCPDYRFPSHWHNDLELSVVLRGQMDYNIDGRIETVHAGEGIFINARHLHSNYSPTQTECEYICVLVHPMVLCFQSGIEREYVAPLLENERLPYVHLNARQAWQQEILQELQAIYAERDEPVAPLLFQGHFCRIWARLFQNVEHGSQRAADSEDLTCIRAMVSYVQDHYQERIALQEIAAAGAVGQSKCCKLFRHYLDLTPNAYLNQCRLDHSRELLLDSTQSMSEIAGAVGYGGASYFTESFRRWYGLTPSEYRRQGGSLR